VLAKQLKFAGCSVGRWLQDKGSDEGTLLIWNRDDVMLGHIEFFRPVSYWDAYELSYQVYGQEPAGQGYATEAVRLLVDYLFGRGRSTASRW
jgi:RimJ/RimL family protein N-acetyltransferase